MILDELASYLQAEGIGTVGTTIVKSQIWPEQTHALVALIEVAGAPPVRTHDGARYEQPVVQVLTRGNPRESEAARVKAQEAWEALDGVSNQLLSSTWYLWIDALQSPFWLRTDEFARPHIVFNIRCARAL